MSQSFEFYDARANESEAEAQVATLDNVRERALRSQAAWRGMASQAKKVEEDRAKAEIARTERRAAEAEEQERRDEVPNPVQMS